MTFRLSFALGFLHSCLNITQICVNLIFVRVTSKVLTVFLWHGARQISMISSFSSCSSFPPSPADHPVFSKSRQRCHVVQFFPPWKTYLSVLVCSLFSCLLFFNWPGSALTSSTSARLLSLVLYYKDLYGRIWSAGQKFMKCVLHVSKNFDSFLSLIYIMTK